MLYRLGHFPCDRGFLGMRTWRGPGRTLPDGMLGPLHPDEWPYGPPEIHEDCCMLFDGATYCDCLASSATDHDGEELVGP